MGINYSKLFHRKQTPQCEPIPGTEQVANSAGGFSWQVDDWQRLDRFLILGAEGGTYYIGESRLVKQNHDAIVRCIKADGQRVVARTIEISDGGRAPKNDPAIFVMALVATHGDNFAKAAAFAGLAKVCRTGTHLFHFAEYVNAMRGWGRGLRKAVAKWYNEKDADALAYQTIKYQQRDGWSHRDLLRLAHPSEPTREHAALYRWIQTGMDGLGEREVGRKVGGELKKAKYPAVAGCLPELIQALEQAKTASSAKEMVSLIVEYNLPREAVPTQFLNDVAVWDALLAKMPMTAMIRNLGKMTNIGLVAPLSEAAKLVVARLMDADHLRRSRVHPLAVLMALKVYAQGHGHRGSLKWKPVQPVVDALDDAFYAAFGNVEPARKPMLYGIDVSGSMGWTIAGTCLSCAEAAAAMALVCAATEPECHIMGFAEGIRDLRISPKMRLDDVLKRTSRINFGGTDCALPMVWAARNQIDVAGFVVLTDSETWYGNIHPAQALRKYRAKMRGDAKEVVVGMVSNGFSIADPNDGGMLDVVGFDASVPNVIADLVRGD